MKTLGLIGGMSWESSAQYYRLINEAVRHRLGGAHSAQLLLWSVDFAGIKQLQHDGQWDLLGNHMLDAARRLQAGGAELLVICTNTMHALAGRIEAGCPLPLLHIADPTAAAILQAGIRKVGLLGTAFTMEQAFYRDRLQDRFGLEVLVPEADDRRSVHDIIYQELICGVVSEHSRQAYAGVIARLVARGAEAIILGCTEIMLLVRAEDSPVPLFDTTTLHALAAVDAALA
ncbi:aspartate/glutamate racemase family protein [Stenotrophomonas maltophilia]|uniref:aspartate/glutamate racemase family protein n=1 Tax=Stenotrophomonas TaxID=40323 RepID=UPI000259BC6F|nr:MULTISPECIES: aspartate/glutamate racemase family protein [Stenotrophomonas]KZE51274.1 racemase [Stenotrophomonas maltophilia]CCH13463.1 Aspartate racemase [Stenotrophomonas maltophilia D457]MBA0340399.1 aspartate/glutamate racemase family protein [Stenotrophomonas maltophilia]MBP2481618.1 aspartate racemase [Stenotrophomonas sp. PvP093]MCF3544672.1 amino acid racemase [Stenotrophomonas maltophilia]